MGRFAEELTGDQLSIIFEILARIRRLAVTWAIGSNQRPLMRQRALRPPSLAATHHRAMHKNHRRPSSPAMDVQAHQFTL